MVTKIISHFDGSNNIFADCISIYVEAENELKGVLARGLGHQKKRIDRPAAKVF